MSYTVRSQDRVWAVTSSQLVFTFVLGPFLFDFKSNMYTPSVMSVILCPLLHVFTNALVQFSKHDIKVQTFHAAIGVIHTGITRGMSASFLKNIYLWPFFPLLLLSTLTFYWSMLNTIQKVSLFIWALISPLIYNRRLNLYVQQSIYLGSWIKQSNSGRQPTFKINCSL